MKRALLLILIFSLINQSASLAAILPAENSNTPSVIKDDHTSIKALSSMSFDEYEKMLGHKASAIEKYAFVRIQKRAVKMYDQDGNLLEKYQKRYNRMLNEEGGSFVGGLALGFFLGAIGLVLAYAVNNDGNKRNRIRGAWWGFIIQAILGIILIIAAYSAVATTA